MGMSVERDQVVEDPDHSPTRETAQPFVDWCAEHGVATHYIQPGKRTEVLNAHVFESLAELRVLTDAWLPTYNGERPHDSLGRVPPLTFLPRPST